MNLTEMQSILEDVVNAWPVWTPEGRKRLLVEELQDYDFERARKGIRALIRDGGIANPSLGDMIEFISRVHVEKPPEHCMICSDLGWVLIDITGQGIYKRCDCGNQNLSRHIDDSLTTDGQKPATYGEAALAFRRGFKKANPEATEEYVQEHLDRWFPRLEEHLF